MKRLLVGYLLLAAALVVSHLIWQRIADRRLAAACAPFTAAGYNLDWQTNGPPAIPDAQNAAAMYVQAFAQLSLTPRQGALVGYLPGDQALQDRYAAEADALVAANAGVLDLCRQARGRKANWAWPHISPSMMTLTAVTPNFSRQRQLTRFLCLAAARQAAREQPAEALQTLLDARALAMAVQQDTALVGRLVAIACTAMQASTIEQIAPHLRTGSVAAGSAPTAAPALIEGMRQLVAALLNDEVNESYRQVWVS